MTLRRTHALARDTRAHLRRKRAWALPRRCCQRLVAAGGAHFTSRRASPRRPAPITMAEPSSALVEGVAGALGGVLGLAATYPLLAVSTRLQLQSGVGEPQFYAASVQRRPRIGDLLFLHPSFNNKHGRDDHHHENTHDQEGVGALQNKGQNISHQKKLGKGPDCANSYITVKTEMVDKGTRLCDKDEYQGKKKLAR